MRGRIALGLALAAIAGGVAGQGAGADPKAGAAADQVVIGRSVQKRAITAVQIGDGAGTRVALVVGVIHGDERAGLRIIRAITALQIGDRAGTRVALVVGAIHGDERAGLRIIRALEREARSQAGALAGTQLWVVPTVNPDGVRARTRKNSHGVDLNRNFPYRWRGDVPQSSGYYPGPRPASEPETRAVMALVRRIRPDLSIWYHQPWGAVLACHGRPQIAVEYAKLVGMGTSCRGEGLRGTATSWETRTIGGGTAFVVEMPSGRISGGSAKRQARAALTVAEGR